ncbi:hypothetical protein BYT27DRAFT_7207421 [Phlegmacium glaucopus]|nr:hypothetical protein BYT27DRAFT_7207421 [Phlegmacium glaucopus]
MSHLRLGTWYWIAITCPLVVEGFLFGLYTGCFVLYLRLHVMNTLKDSDAKRKFLLYPLCILYGLSAVNFGLDINNTLFGFGVSQKTPRQLVLENSIEIATSSVYYFLSQSILIYRCWIVWGRRTSITIIPLLLAFAALGTILSQMSDKVPYLYNVTQALYLAVDGLVMGLIILKIAMVYLEVRPIMAHSGKENKFRPLVFILFILIESGSVAYAFIRVILTQVPLNGIIPTIILVRDALGMSYNDTTPLSQTIETLHFAHNDSSVNSNHEVEELDASGAQDIVQVNRSSTP